MRVAALRPVCALFVLTVVLGTPPARADVPKIVLDAASAPVSELQVIGDGSESSDLRWATWMSGTQPVSNQVWLALLRRQRAASVTVWSTARTEGYLPRILVVTNWQYSGKPTLMFTYQMGAEAEELELYGLDANNTPVLLGHSSAAIFFLRYHDTYFIEARGLLLEPTTCLFFDRARARLATKECPK